ncbi:unannotated protein [freshwater metagenome]|uniref:Unannotated protein n=1 Tax=freshwater metagenome TaxID=449393 RepID=A0A6J7N514_9ZZZZ
MGNEHQGQAIASLHIFKKIEDLRLHGYVQCRDGFVANNHRRLSNNSPSNRDSLALTTRELVRLTLGGSLGIDSDSRENLVYLETPLLRGANFPNVEGFLNDLHDGASGVQRANRILEDHLQPWTCITKLLAPQRTQVSSVKGDLATSRAWKLHNRFASGGLSTTRFAN